MILLIKNICYFYMNYKDKYIKYKNKYLTLKNTKSNLLYGSGRCFNYGFQQHRGECWHDSLSMLLFQSDKLNQNDEYLNAIQSLDVEKKYLELKKLFISPELLKTNAYKLPHFIYAYYLKNISVRDIQDIQDKINKFLELSRNYMSSQKIRVTNRLTHDDELKRYSTDYLLPISEDAKKILRSEKERQLHEYSQKYFDNLNLRISELSDKPEEQAVLIALRDSDKSKQVEMFKRIDTVVENELAKMEQEMIEIERTLKEPIARARRTSFSESLSCDHFIQTITTMFGYKSLSDIKGGNYYTRSIAMDIINLYIDSSHNLICYLYSIDILKDISFDKSISLLTNDNLVGLLVSITDASDRSHVISLYTCINDIIYDDNLSQPIQNGWKSGLAQLIENTQDAQTGTPIGEYYADEKILKQFTLDQINEDNVKPFLTEKIKDLVDSADLKIDFSGIDFSSVDSSILDDVAKKQMKEQMKEQIIKQMKEYYHDKLLKHEYERNVYKIKNLTYVIKTPKTTTESDFLINYVMFRSVIDETFINRLLEINGFPNEKLDALFIKGEYEVSDVNKIKELIFMLLNKRVSYICIGIIINKLNHHILINKTLIEIVYKYPYVISDKDFPKYYSDVNHAILLMNTLVSEQFLEQLKEEDKQTIITDASRSIYNVVIFNTSTNEFDTITKDAIKKKLSLQSGVNNFKQKVIKTLNSGSIP
jgi:hypothetical protein